MGFGGHTVDHPVLARLPADRQEAADPRVRRARLAGEFGITDARLQLPRRLAGRRSTTTRRLVGEAGCDVAFTLAGGRVRPGAADPLALPRMTVGEWLSLDHVKAATALPQSSPGGERGPAAPRRHASSTSRARTSDRTPR
jgi:hypothetical protein